MTRKKALERKETKISNAEVTPQAIWTKGTKGASGLTFKTSEKANSIADCLEIQFTPHNLCDENHERRLEAGV
jgi:hypothetical protein